MTKPMTDRRALALVLAIPVVCWIACWPFVELPVNDDFSYAFTVKRLLETGRLTYNGWSAPIVGVQAYWGALFALASGGFSHLALRASTLPFAIACAGLAYRLHRRLGAPPRWAAFATLVLVGSPLFTPWSASFMTDVPSLAFTLLTFNATLGLARARTLRGVAGCAALLAASAALGGTVRQTNFLFGCVALALEIPRRRRELPAAAAVAAALVGLLLGMFAALGWYGRQPFALGDQMVPINHVARACRGMAALLLTLAMFCLPLTAAWLAIAGLGRRMTASVLAAAAVLCPLGLYAATRLSADDPNGLAAEVGHFLLGIWIGNTLTPTGLLFDAMDAPGERPAVFGWVVRAVIGAGVYASLVLVAIALVRGRHAIVSDVRLTLTDRSGRAAQAVASMGAMVAVYVALLFPRAGLLVIFDRYLLVVIPVVSAGLVLAYRRRMATRGPGAVAWAMVGVWVFVGCVITFEHFAELRARDRVAADLNRLGFPRTAIANGLSYDAWTQLTERGFINDPQVVNPPGAYVPDPQYGTRFAMYWFLPRTPAVQPQWIVVSTPAPPKSLGDRRLYVFDALLPPQRRYLLAWPVRSPAASRPTTRPDATPVKHPEVSKVR